MSATARNFHRNERTKADTRIMFIASCFCGYLLETTPMSVEKCTHRPVLSRTQGCMICDGNLQYLSLFTAFISNFSHLQVLSSYIMCFQTSNGHEVPHCSLLTKWEKNKVQQCAYHKTIVLAVTSYQLLQNLPNLCIWDLLAKIRGPRCEFLLHFNSCRISNSGTYSTAISPIKRVSLKWKVHLMCMQLTQNLQLARDFHKRCQMTSSQYSQKSCSPCPTRWVYFISNSLLLILSN